MVGGGGGLKALSKLASLLTSAGALRLIGPCAAVLRRSVPPPGVRYAGAAAHLAVLAAHTALPPSQAT